VGNKVINVMISQTENRTAGQLKDVDFLSDPWDVQHC
jgi:hypothetical protein